MSPLPILQTDQTDRYQTLHEQFHWHVPADFNIAEACCGRWARDPSHQSRIAIYYEDETGHTATLTYAALQSQAHRLSNVLQSFRVNPF